MMSTTGFIDSHAHFDHLGGEGEVAAVIARAREAGVSRIVAIGGNEGANASAVDVARAHEGVVSAAVGFDRDQAARGTDDAKLRELAGAPGVVAIGEVGLDYHYEPATRKEQMALFERMLDLARESGKPVVVHSREADEDTLGLLRQYVDVLRGSGKLPGVLHCFTGSAEFAAKLLELGMMIGFSGIVTFKNAARLREVAKGVPEDRILIETDSPYLAPEPHRGKQNEPAHVAVVAAALAKIRNDSVEHIAHITADNAVRLFNLNGRQP